MPIPKISKCIPPHIHQALLDMEKIEDVNERASQLNLQAFNTQSIVGCRRASWAIFQMAITAAKQIQNEEQQAIRFEGIAYNLEIAGYLEQAKELLQKAVAFAEKKEDPMARALSLNSIASRFYYGRLKGQADFIDQKAIKAAEGIENPASRSHVLLSLAGSMPGKQKKLKVLQKSIEAAQNIQDQDTRARYYKHVLDTATALGLQKEIFIPQ